MTQSSDSSSLRESAIQGAILQMLRNRGIYCVKVHQTGLSQKGTPDILCCYKGRFIALEVKTATGKTTGLQDREHLMIMKSGGICRIVRTVQAVKDILDEIDNAG